MNRFKKYSLLCLCLLFPVVAQAGVGDKIKSGLSKILPNGIRKWIPGLSPEKKTADLRKNKFQPLKTF